ncbi:hypothetical protein RHGRI_026589 [Rhododendron griersonianum]|uniref:Uncharacterized protein n=1 Tax=Rhododendron griersonianum TaxID=479676 RepID=A0AAV6IVP1_9ERIC|nr:hypothetical protein RHGRI_026589 [Rhododendron griersonianum]
MFGRHNGLKAQRQSWRLVPQPHQTVSTKALTQTTSSGLLRASTRQNSKRSFSASVS